VHGHRLSPYIKIKRFALGCCPEFDMEVMQQLVSISLCKVCLGILRVSFRVRNTEEFKAGAWFIIVRINLKTTMP
jgi:hypothetical protein